MDLLKMETVSTISASNVIARAILSKWEEVIFKATETPVDLTDSDELRGKLAPK